MKTTTLIKTIFLSIFIYFTGTNLNGQNITVTGTITLNPNGLVECYLNYPKLSQNDRTVLFLDTASHLRYIRKKKSGEDSPWKLDWNPAVLKNCFYYTTSSNDKAAGGLPEQFSMHYYFTVPQEAEYSTENMEEALTLSAVRKKVFPLLYNIDTEMALENVNYEIFLERKLKLGLDIKFVELEYEDPFYFAMGTSSKDDHK